MNNLARAGLVCATAAGLLLAPAGTARAGETKGKFRFALQYSYYTVTDEIRSNADNQSTSRSTATGMLEVFTDPRADRAAEKAATISDADAYGFNAAYGIAAWKWGELLIDANYNYFKSQISNLEVSGQFFLADPTAPQIPEIVTKFETFPTTVGSISWSNPQLGGLFRFRPAKALVPYLGVGAGYYFVDFQRSDEIDFISSNLEKSLGDWVRYDPESFKTVVRPTAPLHGIEVEAGDASEVHAVGGIEYNFQGKARHWSAYLDARYMITDGKATITTTGLSDFGQAIPNGTLPDDFPGANTYAVRIEAGNGGLFDIGSAFQDPNNPGHLKKGPPDGILDPGFVFVEGGTLKYGGFLFSLGLRYTF